MKTERAACSGCTRLRASDPAPTVLRSRPTPKEVASHDRGSVAGAAQQTGLCAHVRTLTAYARISWTSGIFAPTSTPLLATLIAGEIFQ